MKTGIAIAILLAGCLAGCVPATASRIRAEFGIGVHDAIGTNEIRSAILKSLPVGTTEGDVLAYLHRRTDGDKCAVISADTNQINCRIDYDPNAVGIVKTSYAIQFFLNERKALKDVQVQEWLTGP